MIYIIPFKRIVFVGAVILCLIGIYGIGRVLPTVATPTTNQIVVIDAGHGGFDPGAIGVSGVEEDDINLAIALKLQKFIEQSGGLTVMTRVDNQGIGNTKREDMRIRKLIRDSSNGNIFISIHLNSFPQSTCKGAQSFYANDENSKQLAEKIQKNLVDLLDKDNARIAKKLTDVYLLKNVTIPSVIIECGFLSNSKEEKLLQDSKYQSKIAMAIYLGITEYFNSQL